ncbi:MAG: DNA replication/repair protein RecF [Clostridia bacterium]|nr:DNA replication/repair protein RecF [Clostridia bacterium]
MNVTALSAVAFRNLKDVSITPCDGMNIFYGDNAHGKTNLLEAVWLMTGGKSFRGSKDADMVMFSNESATIGMTFEARGRRQQIDMTIDKRRHVSLNGLPQATPKRLTGQFCAVIFSPDHLSLIKDGPEERRKFVDAACCQLRPTFMKVLSEYTRLLTQRNTMIKSVKNGEMAFDEVLFDAFDERLAVSGEAVRQYRRDYIEKLTPFATAVYGGLSKGREPFTLCYEQSGEEGKSIIDALRAHRHIDMRAGFTTVGPHRDDLTVMIGDSSARLFGSQGQQRSAVLALKLAEASLLAQSYDEKPIILLDDVMSELDSSRQDYILNHLEGFQVFITCCDPTAILNMKRGAVFHIENGRVERT